MMMIINETSSHQNDSVVSDAPSCGITIIILKTLEVLLMLLENIYSTGVTHDNHHKMINLFLKYRPLDYND
jgi:hypothetical protein